MIVSIIIMLIVALIVIALWVSAVQQHKEKQETERRKDLTKQKKIIEESEDVLLNSANIPMSEHILRSRYGAAITQFERVKESLKGSKRTFRRLNRHH
jgi:FtsZ-interacting cell division protein ZipA